MQVVAATVGDPEGRPNSTFVKGVHARILLAVGGRGVRWRVLGSVALAAMTAVLLSCGQEAALNAGETPGYRGEARQTDRSGFEIPRADGSAASSTIPGPAPTLARPWQETTTTALNITTTTVATLPDEITFPVSDDPVCRAFYFVASGLRSGQRLVYEAERNGVELPFADLRDPLVESMETGAAELESSVVADGGADVPTVFHRRLRSAAELVRGTTNFSQHPGFMYEITTAPPRAGEVLDWADIEAYLNRACPTLILELSGVTTLKLE